MNATALLRVDAQWAFTPEWGLPVEQGRKIVPGVNQVTREALERWMMILDTVDLHPEGHISFASRHGLAPYSPNPLNPKDLLWPEHSVRGKDIELIEGIIDPAECVKIYKGWMRNRDAYSGFDMGVTKLLWNPHGGYEVAPGAKTLLEVLRAHQIKTLRIVGLVTEVCVTANALDALDQGYDVELVESGIRGLSKDWHEQALRDLHSLDGTPNRQGRIQSVKILTWI